jgi:hypothetical protein
MGTSTKRLIKARATRSKISETFRMLENAHVTIDELLTSPPQCLTRIRVYDVLRRCPHLNRAGAEKVLRNAKVWPLTTWGNLTPDERQAIASHLPPRARGD